MVRTHTMNWVMLFQLAVCGFVVRCAPATTRFESIWHGAKNGCSNPCENIGANICSTQGVCVRDGCGWNCRCYAGYTGKFCEERVFSAAPVSSTNKKTYDPIVNGNILDMLDQTLRDSTTSSTTASTTPAKTTMISTSPSTTSTSSSVQSKTSSAIMSRRSTSVVSISITPINSPTSTSATTVNLPESSTPLTTSPPLLTTPLPRSSLLLVPLSILGVFNWKSAAVTKALTGEMNTIGSSRITKTTSLKTTAETRIHLAEVPTAMEPTLKSADTTSRPDLTTSPAVLANKTVSSRRDQITSKSAEIPRTPRVKSTTNLNRKFPKRQGKIVLGALHPRSEDVILPIDSIPTIEHLLNAEPQNTGSGSHGDSMQEPNVTEGLKQYTHATEVGQKGPPNDAVIQDQTPDPSSVEINDDDSNTNTPDKHMSNDNGNSHNAAVDTNLNISGEETVVVGQSEFSNGNGNSDMNNNEEKGQTNNASNVSVQDITANGEYVININGTHNTDNGNSANESSISNGQNTTEGNSAWDNGTHGNETTSDNDAGDKHAASGNETDIKNEVTQVTHKEITAKTSNHYSNGNSQNGDNGNKTNEDNGGGNIGIDNGATSKDTAILVSGFKSRNITENRIQKDNTGQASGKNLGGLDSVDNIQQKQTFTTEAIPQSSINDDKGVVTKVSTNVDRTGTGDNGRGQSDNSNSGSDIRTGSSDNGNGRRDSGNRRSDNGSVNNGNKHSNGSQRNDSALAKTADSSNASSSDSGVKDMNAEVHSSNSHGISNSATRNIKTEVHSISNLHGGSSDSGHVSASYRVTSSDDGHREASTASTTLNVNPVDPMNNGDPPSHGDRARNMEGGGSKRDAVGHTRGNSGGLEGRTDSKQNVERNGSGSPNGKGDQTVDNNSSQNVRRHLENRNGHSISENGGD